MRKLEILVFVALISCVWYLVAVSGGKPATASQNGLECVYNCDDFELLLKARTVEEKVLPIHRGYGVQFTGKVQRTAKMQVTANNDMLRGYDAK